MERKFPMNSRDHRKNAMEEFLAAVFRELHLIAYTEGITVKRMRQILPRVQLEMLKEQGMTEHEISAQSGYSRPSIRKILKEPISNDETNRLERFIAHWTADSEFPDRLALDGLYPSFAHLCETYAGDFTPTTLLRLLQSYNAVSFEDGVICLQTHMVDTLPNTKEPSANYESVEKFLRNFQLEPFISNWNADPKYPNRLAISGKSPNFEQLCDAYSDGCPPNALLQLLEERSIIHREGDTVVIKPGLVKAVLEVEKIRAAHHSVTALLQTLQNNLDTKKTPMMERRIWSNQVPPNNLAALRAEITSIMTDTYHQKILPTIAKYQTPPRADQQPNNQPLNVGIGIYWYEHQPKSN